MPQTPNKTLRKLFAMTCFVLVFLLTPRAWVDGELSGGERAVPVQALEGPLDADRCLWCVPMQPVDCERDDAQPSSPERLWLNPDEPPTQDNTPCLTPPPQRAPGA